MKTNANEGLMTFLEAMKSKGGFDQMAPMFEAMNLNGTRAVGVLSAVASHLDQVKTAQDLATKSYSDGTSVLNEFNTQNSTVQANLDKAKKQFQDLNIELGKTDTYISLCHLYNEYCNTNISNISKLRC